MTPAELNVRLNHQTISFDNPKEARPYLAFDFNLPTYLPEGYAFDRIELYSEDQGPPKSNGEYAAVYFSRGEDSMQLRLMNGETAYTTDAKDMKGTKINGHEAAVGKTKLDIEINGVMYMFMARNSGIYESELIKMAESL